MAVATLCREAAQLHPRLNRDLLVTAALLHDIGRAGRSGRGVTIAVSEQGRLLGHVLAGVRMIDAAAGEVGLADDVLLPLLNAVAGLDVLYPMRRRDTAPKGPLPPGKERSAFEPISWDEAIDSIAQRLAHISRKFGPEAILPYSYAGTIGALGYGSMDRRFFHRLGASQLDRTICSSAGGEALVAVYGRKMGTDPEHFRHSRYIVAWASEHPRKQRAPVADD